jgi:hypothetical protein
MSFIVSWQDGKLRGMCRVPAIYFENINVEKERSRVAIPVGPLAAGGQHYA